MPVLGKPSEYNFYVDVEWSDNKKYDITIKQILKYTHNFNILGEYKRYEEEGLTNKPAHKIEKAKRTYIEIKKLKNTPLK
jgi:prephenate dehydratase